MQRILGIVLALLFIRLSLSSSPAGDPVFIRALYAREWVVTSMIPLFFANPLQVNDRACYEHADCGSGAVCTWKNRVCEQPGRCLQGPFVAVAIDDTIPPVCGCDGYTHRGSNMIALVGKAHEGPCEEKGTLTWLMSLFSGVFGGDEKSGQ